MPQSPPALPALLTPAEAAAALNVDTRTLRNWANTGRIDLIELPGGHARYRRVDIERLAEPKVTTPVSDDLLPQRDSA